MFVAEVRHLDADLTGWVIPAALEAVQAGFPSPAQDYWSGDLDLASLMLPNRASTFIVRVAGDSMIGAGIFDQDLAVVDRAVEPRDGDIVIAIIGGSDLTVKRLRITPSGVILAAENPDYPDLRLRGLEELTVWGVVTWTVRRFPHG